MSVRNKAKRKQLTTLKKQINELFLMGDMSQDEGEQILAGADTIEDGPSTPVIRTVSRRLHEARMEKQSGPQLALNLDRLNGALMSNGEIRELLHFSVLGSTVSKPKWAFFRPWKSTSQTLLIRVNCKPDYIENNEYSFNFVDNFFCKQWIRMDEEVFDRKLFWKNMVSVPVSLQEQVRERMLQLDPLNGRIPRGDSLKMELLITSAAMVDNLYPCPDKEFIATKDRYKAVSSNSPLFALDCEMCKTEAGKSELTRISITRADGSVVLDTLVKPKERIIDYVTKFSGITREMMQDVDVTLEDVQAAIRAVLPPDAIICGHSLEFDFRAMKMAHPYCIDIGLIYNLSGGMGRSKTSLKNLMWLFLGEDIQGKHGHCSIEDAYAAMKLIDLKLENGLIFGNCAYGWNYDEYQKLRKERIKQNGPPKESEGSDQSGETSKDSAECEEDEAPIKKRKLSRDCRSPLPKCECGRDIGIRCLIEDCLCQKSPPSQCIKCLAKMAVNDDDECTFNWSKALRPDTSKKTRPITYYMVDSKKTVHCAFDETEGVEVQKTKTVSIVKPSSFPTLVDFVEETACDMMSHGMAMVELDYLGREEEILEAAPKTEEDDEDSLEDGQLPSVREEVVKAIDEHVERLIRSTAKHSLIMLVMTSEEASICYLKVKN